VDWSGSEAETAKAIALVIVALLLPLVSCLLLRDTWRKLQGPRHPNADAP
jgi:hypothetical protein